ncbi:MULTISPECIES: amino acid permease [Chryseobacterium]|uniref:APA family basic amino acid/polyamine antiporter n=1 Tax=Chryseobacterium geocarposphaerae TaxID=1416776 RepID=A0ABU1L9C9_9FLAO|nr:MULTISPECIES: amino acid permease [Chryseobacterium]MDR6403324.1 APA family basic amino acid/polyamine antiporter [Chryseobacterium geocarposphaerae]MDR6696878.1 APA family basic amino acid/polyamine antiporter [Chryseobacterium ginsenosidimutans]
MSKIWVKKPMSAYEADIKKSQLKRVLGKWSLTAIGIGAIIGGGIFVLTGTGAYYNAGPALALSFVIAGIACVFAALCYAEFASILPVEGSAYAYAYGTVGEIFAWIIGWGLILEYAMGSMTVAVSWSGYFSKLLKMFGLHLPDYLTMDPQTYIAAGNSGFSMNLPAFCIVLFVISILLRGTKGAAKANNFIVVLKVSAIIFVIIAGAFFINPENWTPFIPEATVITENGVSHNAYGLGGVVAGASAIFFAYVGFDAVSTQAGEAINPKKDVPFAIIASLVICTLLYILVSLVLTGMMHYTDFNPLGKYPDAIKAPVAYAFDIAGQAWAGYIITIAATVGLISVLMVMIMGQSRIFLGMSKDGLIPATFSKVNAETGVPTKNLLILGVVISIIASLTPINDLAHMTSFGTLFAFTMVCVAVWVLRVKEPQLQRNFKVPALPLIACCGILINIYLIINLSKEAQMYSLAWLVIGFVIYFLYSKKHSKIQNGGYGETFKAEQEPLEKPDLDL